MPPQRNNQPIGLDPELKAIFGDNLVTMLENWDAATIPSQLQSDPNHSGITDEDIQNFVNQRIGTLGPRPLNSDQAPRPPQFLPGKSGRPPAGGIEDNGQIANPTTLPPENLTSEQESSPGSDTDTDTQDIEGEIDYSQFINETGEEDTTPTPTDFITVDDEKLPIDTVRAFKSFNDRLKTDPRLQQILVTYAETGRIPPELAGIESAPQFPPAQGVPGQAASPVQGQPLPSPLFEPPTSAPTVPQPITIPEGYEDDPVIQSLMPAISAQNQQIAQLTALVQAQQQQTMAQAQQQQMAIVNRGVASFQQQKNLNDDQITRLRQAAGRIPIVDTFLKTGIDPRTGLPTTPDPLTAIETALDIAYWAMPEFRQLELNRQQELRRQDTERKRKAGSLSGNSGSAPRTNAPVRPGTPEARQAMISDLNAMMNGTYSDQERN